MTENSDKDVEMGSLIHTWCKQHCKPLWKIVWHCLTKLNILLV